MATDFDKPSVFDTATAQRVLVATDRVLKTRRLSADGGGAVNVPPLGIVRAFRLTQAGGVAGTNNATCSFTYNVYAFSDASKTTAIATSVAMTGSANRIASVTYTAANYGTGLYDSSAVSSNNASGVVLLWCDEVPQTGSC